MDEDKKCQDENHWRECWTIDGKKNLCRAPSTISAPQQKFSTSSMASPLTDSKSLLAYVSFTP